MKKIFRLLMLTLCGAGTSGALAGGMGDTTMEPASFRPFISGEGLYSWPQVQGITIRIPSPEVNIGHSNNINQGWGGRVAAGMMHSMAYGFAYSGEVGWGYYGHTRMPMKFSAPLGTRALAAGLGNTTGNLDRWGFDALLGLMYTQTKYDLYVKAGALFENLRFSLSDIVLNDNGGTISTNTTTLGVLPEIKLGAAYHMTDHLAANVSWMYAFGNSFNVYLPYNESNSIVSMAAMDQNLSSPSMNVVMFGLEYRFG